MKFNRLLFPVLLALPPVVLASEPVRVTTQMSGQIDASPVVLERLGIGDYWERPGPLPFSLTIDTVVDPDDFPGWCHDSSCFSVPADVALSLTIDGRTVGFSDSRTGAHLSWSALAFQNGTSYRTEPYPSTSGSFVFLDTWVNPINGNFDANPFMPRHFDQTDVTGFFRMNVSPLDPETPGYWFAYGTAERVDFQVSVVPEANGSVMLVAGLGVLGLAGWRRTLLAPGSHAA